MSLITSLPTIRQGKKRNERMKSRGRQCPRPCDVPEMAALLRNSDLARPGMFRLRQRQTHDALIDFCADFIRDGVAGTSARNY
jgi:hypothetical protein